MAEWEKEIAELKTDVKYIREDIGIMQKQVRDLNKHTNMGLGGIKRLKNSLYLRGFNAGALVADRDLQVLMMNGGAQNNLTARRVHLTGIVNKIKQRAL